MSDQHNALIKTPRQLITVVILAFVVPVIVIILLANFVSGDKTSGAGSDAMTPEAIAERLKPVGMIALQEAGGARALQSGDAVYKAACAACHATGAAGAPKVGDPAAWGPRIKQGFDTLVKHAVSIAGVDHAINYGLNRVRFISAVPAGARIRARVTPASMEEIDGGYVQVLWHVIIDREGSEKPCLAAEWLVRYHIGRGRP